MKKLKMLVRNNNPIRHPKDVKKLKKILNRAGYDASDEDIQYAYETYCEYTLCAGWIDLKCFSEEELRNSIMSVLEKEQK